MLGEAEEIDCSPQLMSINGHGHVERARVTNRRDGARPVGKRPPVKRSMTSSRNRLAMAIRQVTRVNGVMPASSPILMNRNDEPQMMRQ